MSQHSQLPLAFELRPMNSVTGSSATTIEIAPDFTATHETNIHSVLMCILLICTTIASGTAIIFIIAFSFSFVGESTCLIHFHFSLLIIRYITQIQFDQQLKSLSTLKMIIQQAIQLI